MVFVEAVYYGEYKSIVIFYFNQLFRRYVFTSPILNVVGLCSLPTEKYYLQWYITVSKHCFNVNICWFQTMTYLYNCNIRIYWYVIFWTLNYMDNIFWWGRISFILVVAWNIFFFKLAEKRIKVVAYDHQWNIKGT